MFNCLKMQYFATVNNTKARMDKDDTFWNISFSEIPTILSDIPVEKNVRKSREAWYREIWGGRRKTIPGLSRPWTEGGVFLSQDCKSRRSILSCADFSKFDKYPVKLRKDQTN